MAGDRNNPLPEDVLMNAHRAMMMREQSSFPAICTSAEGADNRVTVQPALRISTKQGQQVTPKPVTIPVEWPSWGAYVWQGTLSAGDEVIVECMDANWNEWLVAGGVVDNTQLGGRDSGYAIAKPRMISAPSRPGPMPAGVAIRLGRKDSLTTVELNADGSIRLAATEVTLTSGTGLSEFLTDLHTAIAGWTPVANDGGAALKAALAAWLLLLPPTGGPPPT